MQNRMCIENSRSIFVLLVCLLSTQGCIAVTPVVRSQDGIIHFDQGEVRSVAISRGDRPYILSALSFEGAASLSGDGELIDSFDPEDPLSEIVGISISDEFQHGNRKLHVVAMVDWTKFRVVLRGLEPASGRFIEAGLFTGEGILDVPPRTTHVCFSRDPYDDSLYLFAGGDHGRLLQFRIYSTASGKISTSELQQVVIGGPTSSCDSDDHNGIVYVTEPDMGLWQVYTDPEEVPLREPVALNKPYGKLDEPLSIAGIFEGEERQSLLADTGIEGFLRLSADGSVVAQRPFSEAFANRPMNGSMAGIAVGRLPLRGTMQDVIAVAVSGDIGDGDIYIIPLLTTGAVSIDPRQAAKADAVVRPRVLSAPVSERMDAADDPAIWINPRDPSRSLVLGADKGAGLAVYDLGGSLLQFLPDGRINNVDVRSGFANNPVLAHIAVGSDRTNTALAIYAIDEATGHLSRVDARTIPAEFHDVYGLCMYRSSRTGDLYVFATSGDGLVNQWRLFPVAGNRVDAELVRRITIGSVAEGCVADDENGFFYVSQETVAVWRYGAEPGDGEERTAVARIEAGGVLTEDLEGLAIYKTTNDNGYLIVTSQGSDNYSVYERLPPHVYRGTFRIRANPETGIDGTSQTDGIDVTHIPLPGYPRGLLVAQDGRYDESQNFKYVSWADIAEQLGLR